ncbi:hypothetical protein LNKW23_00590 [Paralimibaculum aggregatum]|uniref:Uncharacterized protein n=1 Tax=Paralimibaculum aggregatum TaxID=3036245 RepID=A0ABQ6LCY3_9RHOB|nr:hypothetical protein [Limibaculum sp. NKW23]GMG80847.1 hypothetical protein LNKW23_00590 [Limibaculum sp. NKW23]
MSAVMTNGVGDFLDAPITRRYLAEIVDDTETALTRAQRNIRSGALAQCKPGTLGTYKSDRAALEAASADFHDEWNRAINDEVETLDDFQDAYQTLLLALELLERENVAFTAVVTTDLGAKLAKYFGILILFSPLADRFARLRRDLDGIMSDLVRAKRAAKAKSAKAALAICIAGAAVALGPMSLGMTIGVALGTTAVGLVIDEVVGNGASGGALQNANKGAGAAAKILNANLKEPYKGVGTIVSGVAAVVATGDAAAAIVRKTRLEARAKKLEADYKALLKELKMLVAKVSVAQKEANAAHREALSKAGRFRSQTGARKGLFAGG